MCRLFARGNPCSVSFCLWSPYRCKSRSHSLPSLIDSFTSSWVLSQVARQICQANPPAHWPRIWAPDIQKGNFMSSESVVCEPRFCSGRFGGEPWPTSITTNATLDPEVFFCSASTKRVSEFRMSLSCNVGKTNINHPFGMVYTTY